MSAGRDEREQARGGSGEPPVPDAGTKVGDVERAGAEVAGEREGATGPPSGAAQPGADRTEAVQVPEPHETGVPDDLRAEIEQAMGRYPEKRSAAIPALFAVQSRYGWCTPEGIRQAAAVMGVTPAYLEGVATFYDLLHTEPAGRHKVLVCTNISCWMRGADGLLESFCSAAGVDPHEAGHGGAVTADGEIYVSGFECLGACDLAPMISVDGRYYGPVADGEAASVLATLREGGEVLPDRAMAIRPAAGGPSGEPDPRVAGAE